MIRAHAEQFVYNAPSPWWTVGTGIGTAFLAGIFATIGWYVIHRNSRTRDLDNWRRTTLIEAATNLMLKDIELHSDIVTYLYTSDESNSMEFYKLLFQKKYHITANIIQLEATQSKNILPLAIELSEHYKKFINELPLPTALDDASLDNRSAIFKKRNDQKPDISDLRKLLITDLTNQ
ncbi:hypothetical protein HQP04_21100 [Rhodococcus fascians]|nr:hypothetical protein [Rhodococcus fascians]MBY4024525.1 hypothetical protein [Rhodococcus fascians]